MRARWLQQLPFTRPSSVRHSHVKPVGRPCMPAQTAPVNRLPLRADHQHSGTHQHQAGAFMAGHAFLEQAP